MSSTYGKIFKITTWGESHGDAVGVVIDGCPPRIPLSIEDIQPALTRRRPGQSNISTQRKEADEVQILSGVFDGQTLGTPISLVVWNRDQRSKDYGHMETTYRPSHADYTYQAKYGIRNWRGGGRSSARETIGRVAAGAVAEKILQSFYGIEIVAWVDQVRDIVAEVDGNTVSREDVEANVARCPDEATAQVMIDGIKAARKAGDSLGGIVEAVVRGLPAGWGEPVFDKIDADLAKAMLSLPACKGFEVGSGFGGIALSGAEHNDTFYMEGDRVRTRTNRSGGVQGGITNGENLTMRAAFKPTATIIKEQDSVNEAGEDVQFKGRGRHDPCVLPRAVPIVEAMIALTLIDHAMRQQAIQHPVSE
ncbi:MAG: chorismate synthase [Deltaproteobacteria bacterium]|nr:chorismate synthase [Deltaproteobacteria bacterium]